MKKTFIEKLIKGIQKKNSILCVGLDPQVRYLPEFMKKEFNRKYKDPFEGAAKCILEFNKIVIDNIKDFTVIIKPQAAFYEKYGFWGMKSFSETVKFAKEKDLLVLSDVKRGDGGDTAEAYKDTYLGQVEGLDMKSMKSRFESDAVTLNIQIGSSCLDPFLNASIENQKGIFAICKTSFKPNSEIENFKTETGDPIWTKIAEFINEKGKKTPEFMGFNNLGAVIGATYPKEAKLARKIMPNTWFLVPGYGAQGGGAFDAIQGMDKKGLGIIVNSSRGITASFKDKGLNKDKGFEKYIREAAKNSRDDLNKAKEKFLNSK